MSSATSFFWQLSQEKRIMNLEEHEKIIPNAHAEGLTWLTPNQHGAAAN